MEAPELPDAPLQPKRRGPSTAAWVGSVALWVLMSIPSALRNGDDQPGQTVGALLGGLLGTFAIALLLRVIYVRLVARERPVLSPWVFVIAAVLALMVNLSQVANETAEREAGEPEAGQAATAASPEDLLVALPEGVRYETISAAQRPGDRALVAGRGAQRRDRGAKHPQRAAPGHRAGGRTRGS